MIKITKICNHCQNEYQITIIDANDDVQQYINEYPCSHCHKKNIEIDVDSDELLERMDNIINNNYILDNSRTFQMILIIILFNTIVMILSFLRIRVFPEVSF